MANVLTKGSVLTDNLFMQRIWAWTQCIAIDASVAGTIIRTFRYYAQGERVKYLLYGFLSGLLLFTAAIVSNIESVQQTLNIALEAAYVHVLVPVEALIWIRSLAIVLLIVAHALRHVQKEPEQPVLDTVAALQSAPLVLTPELVDALRVALTQVTVSEECEIAQPLPQPQSEQGRTGGKQGASTAQGALAVCDDKQETNEGGQEASNYERVKAYLVAHPEVTDRQIADALAISRSTVNKWRKRLKAASGYSEQCS
jgi:hypothetical protein